MTMEGFKDEKKAPTNEEILDKLRQRLKKIQTDLGKTTKTEDVGLIADDEDLKEAREEGEARQALGAELSMGEKEIAGAIKWIEIHGNNCAFPGCQNKVSDRRRQADLASITCTEHMEEEDGVLKDLAMGL